MTEGLRTFEGGVAIVTGAASGIGRAISAELARRGCLVVLTDIDFDEAETAAVQIRNTGGQAFAKRLDVTHFTEVNDLVAQTISEHGRVDYIFNNAGIGVAGEVADHT